MSGAFAMPHSLTGGAGYKANPTYDAVLSKTKFYRKYSSAGKALEEDRRRSSIANDDAAQAVANVQAEAANPSGRKASIADATGGAAAANIRKGSVVVASSSDRRDSLFGMESSAGVQMDPNRRPSTSLASDLFHKIKGSRIDQSTKFTEQ